ncbi:serine O-acetyltransferase [Granulicella rosea]|uniref:Serine acetyltransferase n=1 Tax=Granulicella rosea TaxID=474952 RepID=A0A239ETX6_9BACT|nr:serine acetyltransferase [Granulicella rosea]SNS47871.1 serine O-acetyltransferase [Granulicella rosea]
MFENIREDWRANDSTWTRHGFWVLTVYRFGRWRYGIKSRLLRMPLSFLYKLLKFFADSVLGMEMPCETVIGRRLVIEHTGGIVISGDAIFGDDCVLRNGVTVGLRNRSFRGSPRIGARVDIGTGAKLLGPIVIGDDVAIGANAVVLCDVPSNSIAVGVPARVLPRKPVAVAEVVQ